MRGLIYILLVVTSWSINAASANTPETSTNGYFFRIDARPYPLVFGDGFPVHGSNTNVRDVATGEACSGSADGTWSDGNSSFVLFEEDYVAARRLAREHSLSRDVTLYWVIPGQNMYNLRRSLQNQAQDWSRLLNFRPIPLVPSTRWIAHGGVAPEFVFRAETFRSGGQIPIAVNTNRYVENNARSNPNANPYSETSVTPPSFDTDDVLFDMAGYAAQAEDELFNVGRIRGLPALACITNFDYSCFEGSVMYSGTTSPPAIANGQCPDYQPKFGRMTIQQYNARVLLPLLMF